MSATVLAPELTENEELHRWRIDCFLEYGCTLQEAIELAEARVSPHHEFKGLIDAGASLDEARRICL